MHKFWWFSGYLFDVVIPNMIFICDTYKKILTLPHLDTSKKGNRLRDKSAVVGFLITVIIKASCLLKKTFIFTVIDDLSLFKRLYYNHNFGQFFKSIFFRSHLDSAPQNTDYKMVHEIDLKKKTFQNQTTLVRYEYSYCYLPTNFMLI